MIKLLKLSLPLNISDQSLSLTWTWVRPINVIMDICETLQHLNGHGWNPSISKWTGVRPPDHEKSDS